MTKQEWEDRIYKAAAIGDYKTLVHLLASNCGDCGNVESWIDNLVSEMDPMD